jgi:hypothetical protein
MGFPDVVYQGGVGVKVRRQGAERPLGGRVRRGLGYGGRHNASFHGVLGLRRQASPRSVLDNPGEPGGCDTLSPQAESLTPCAHDGSNVTIFILGRGQQHDLCQKHDAKGRPSASRPPL